MTRQQLTGRRDRLLRELSDMAGTASPPADRIERLARDLADCERRLQALDGLPSHVGIDDLARRHASASAAPPA